MSADVTVFGKTRQGTEVQAITLRGGGLTARVLTHGATLQDLRLEGVDWPLTLGSAELAAYEGPMAHFGPIVGPVANRIAGARAEIDGRLCRFDVNVGADTTLHSGPTGIQHQVWSIADARADRVTLTLDLPDGLGGFPGNRRIESVISVEAEAALTFRLTATTDAPTLVNLTNHSYWNLDGSETIAGHWLRVAANSFLPLTDAYIPTGEVREVAGTVFDLRGGRTLKAQRTYDVNLCLADGPRQLTEVAELIGQSGVRLRLATTEPGLQVYDMSSAGSSPFVGHGGRPYGSFAGLALEAQLWPDAVHHTAFPSILLRPDETREQVTRLRFDRT